MCYLSPGGFDKNFNVSMAVSIYWCQFELYGRQAGDPLLFGVPSGRGYFIFGNLKKRYY